MDIVKFWKYALEQNAEQMRAFFCENGYVNWHCTNEHFDVDEFIRANCEYPGAWEGIVERTEVMNDLIVTVTHVYPKDKTASFHVTSFSKSRIQKFYQLMNIGPRMVKLPTGGKRLKLGGRFGKFLFV